MARQGCHHPTGLSRASERPAAVVTRRRSTNRLLIMAFSHVPCYVWEYADDVILQNPDGQEVSMSRKQVWLHDSK